MRAGYGEEIITPPLGTELTGYGYYPDRKSEGILDDLKVRVLFLKEKEVNVILISCELLGLPAELADTVRKEISADENVPSENILISFTHPHTGPACQYLRGALGEINAEYLKELPGKIKKAVQQAAGERKEAEVFYSFETVEPIGFNRRNGSFDPIDPLLKVVIFKRADRKIYLTGYACHPVVLGRIKEISADWPGALIREIEKDGNHGIFFQGFCGDIDPVTNMNRWGAGTAEDLGLYGRLLYERVLKSEKYSHKITNPDLLGMEKRIKLPLKVLNKEGIEKERQLWMEKKNAACDRFIRDWEKEVKGRYKLLLNNPYMEDIPVQLISIGELRIVCLPGEVFCEYDLKLRKKYPALVTVGNANGCIGYIPTRKAYEKDGDYACYGAPKFYSFFPFLPEIEDILMEELAGMLF